MLERPGARWCAPLLFGLAGWAGCASGRSAERGSAPEQRGPPRAEVGAVLHPPPFTAEQIRSATGEGRHYRWRVITPRGITLRDVRFEKVDRDGAVVVARMLDPEGAPLGSPERTPVSWGELEEHAVYPAEGTTVEVTEVEVPAGSFEAWRYDVRIRTEEGERHTAAWFAPELPGAPVRHEVREDGELVSTMELLVHESS